MGSTGKNRPAEKKKRNAWSFYQVLWSWQHGKSLVGWMISMTWSYCGSDIAEDPRKCRTTIGIRWPSPQYLQRRVRLHTPRGIGSAAMIWSSYRIHSMTWVTKRNDASIYSEGEIVHIARPSWRWCWWCISARNHQLLGPGLALQEWSTDFQEMFI